MIGRGLRLKIPLLATVVASVKKIQKRMRLRNARVAERKAGAVYIDIVNFITATS